MPLNYFGVCVTQGSGKTLAFAIPIIHRILEKSARAAIEENNNGELNSH